MKQAALFTFYAVSLIIRLDIEIMDRFGHPVVPREWFLVPLFIIREAVERIKEGTIVDYLYDPKTASLKLRKGK